MKKISAVSEGMYSVSSLEFGSFVRLNRNSHITYILDSYDRSERKYVLIDYSDFCNVKYVMGTKKVFSGFIF